MSQMLRGIRVLDLTRMLAGPYATMLLADLGAEVIKVEEPAGDPIRRMGPPFEADGRAAYFMAVNRNKKSVVLDLRKEEDRGRFLELVKTADVVIDNFRAGVIERLGVTAGVLRAARPDLVTCSMTAFGSDGPYRELPAFAVCAALVQRDRSGRGEHIDLALLDVQVSLLTYIAQYYLTDGKVPGPVGTGHQSVVPYQAFPTADGFVVVAVFVENFWAPLCKVLGAPELVERHPDNASRVAARDELVPNLEARFLQQNTDEWVRELWAAGVPSGPVNTLDRVLSDPQVLHRRMVVSDGERRLIGNPIKTGTEGTFTPAPELGAHNGEYLG